MAVRKNFLLTEFSCNLPSKKMFLMCCMTPRRSTSKSVAIYSCVNQTALSSKRTFTNIFLSSFLNKINSELLLSIFVRFLKSYVSNYKLNYLLLNPSFTKCYTFFYQRTHINIFHHRWNFISIVGYYFFQLFA